MGFELIVIGAAVIALIGGVGAAAAGASRGARAYQDQVEARWSAAAEAIGGHLEVVSRKLLEPRALRLRVDRDGVHAVALLAVPVSRDVLTHTVARAGYVLGVGPRFAARPRLVHEPAESGLPRSLRTTSGNPAAAFTGELTELAESIHRPLTVQGDGERVEVIWDGAEQDASVLGDALSLVVGLARHGADYLRGLSTIEDAELELASEEGPRVRVRRDLVEVRIVVQADRGEPVYRARVDARAGTPELVVAIGVDGAPEGTLPEGFVDPGSSRALARVGPATLSSRAERIEIEWPEPPSLEQADAAVSLLAALGASRGSQGAFR